MNKSLLLPLAVLCLSFFASCNDAPSSKKQTILTGTVTVSVDESLEPIVRDQLEVFQHSYPNADIFLDVKPENSLFNDLVTVQSEIAVATRLLSSEEMKAFERRSFTPRVTKFANDAVVLIGNRAHADTSISVNAVMELMRGSGERSIVFENANSSTLRYLKDLAGIDSLPQHGVYALQSSRSVLQYVAENENALGVVGLTWLVRSDSLTREFLDRIRILSVEVRGIEGLKDGVFEPSQTNLATGVYPFIRPVYLINAEPRQGLGIGFAAFLAGDRGQRIILKSGLMPDSLPPRELILRK